MSKKTLLNEYLTSKKENEENKTMARGIFPQLGEMFESKCPECGNIDNLTKEETQRTVHCQICYKHYEYEGDKQCVKKS